MTIRDMLKGNDFIYCFYQFLKHRKEQDFIDLVRGYYVFQYKASSIIINHYGDAMPDQLVSNIFIADLPGQGFTGQIIFTLSELDRAEVLCSKPVITWIGGPYYDEGMAGQTKNIFEYYFEPCKLDNNLEVCQCQNVLEHAVLRQSHLGNFRKDSRVAYAYCENIDMEKMRRMAFLYKKYIRLNADTRDYIENNITRMIGDKKILGLHIRGTDFNAGIARHPVAVNPRDFVKAVRAKISSEIYDNIFLATDDSSVYELLKNEFGDALISYSDVFRTTGMYGPHATESGRTLHHYKLGLEVLRDVYTLASCESLICGLSSVSFVARIVNIAFCKEYKDIIILENGRYENYSEAVIKLRKKGEI